MEIFLKICLCLYITNFKNKLKFNDFLKTKKNKNTQLTVQIFFNLQNHPSFHSQERLVNLVRRREWFVGLSKVSTFPSLLGIRIQALYKYIFLTSATVCCSQAAISPLPIYLPHLSNCLLVSSCYLSPYNISSSPQQLFSILNLRVAVSLYEWAEEYL